MSQRGQLTLGIPVPPVGVPALCPGLRFLSQNPDNESWEAIEGG